jgi:hypothetical protein
VKASERGGVVSRLILRWSLATLAMLALVMPLTLVMALLGAQDVTIGPAQFPLLVFHQGGVILSLDLNAIFAAALLFALLSVLVERRARRGGSDAAQDGSPHPAFL